MGKQHYSVEFKSRILDKLYSSPAESLSTLSKEYGIPINTICRWKIKAQQNKLVSEDILPKDWIYQSKVEAVFESSKLSGEELGGWLRAKGLYSEYLELWKKEIMNMAPSKSDEDKKAIKQLQKEKQRLKSELLRKDKALAEASALLILKKKAQLIWGVAEED